MSGLPRRKSLHGGMCLLFAGLVGLSVSDPVGAQSAAPAPTWQKQDTAILRAIDKVTARISTVTAPIDQPVRFGAFEIVVRSCQDRPPTETPENAAFLQIDEDRPDAPRKRIFSGWMFSSSPALNALEHPVYDIWVHACSSSETAAESSSPS